MVMSARVEEFYNSHHAKSDGRFTSGGSGGTGKHIPFTPTTPAQNAQFKQERADLAKNGGKSKTAADAPTYKGQSAVRRAISKSSNRFGQSGTFEITLKDGSRSEISVQHTTNTHVFGKGGMGDYRVAFKDIASAKPLGIATNNARDHLPFKSGGTAHTQQPVRKHSTPNFIETNKVRHVKDVGDWTKPGAGSRHPAGVTGHTKVKVRKGLFGK